MENDSLSFEELLTWLFNAYQTNNFAHLVNCVYSKLSEIKTFKKIKKMENEPEIKMNVITEEIVPSPSQNFINNVMNTIGNNSPKINKSKWNCKVVVSTSEGNYAINKEISEYDKSSLKGKISDSFIIDYIVKDIFKNRFNCQQHKLFYNKINKMKRYTDLKRITKFVEHNSLKQYVCNFSNTEYRNTSETCALTHVYEVPLSTNDDECKSNNTNLFDFSEENTEETTTSIALSEILMKSRQKKNTTLFDANVLNKIHRLKNILEELNKALNFCHIPNMAYIEAKKLLLLATMTKDILQNRENFDTHYSSIIHKIHPTVTLKINNMEFRVLKKASDTENTVYWYLVTCQCGDRLLSTTYNTINNDGYLVFEDVLMFTGLKDDFEIIVTLHELGNTEKQNACTGKKRSLCSFLPKITLKSKSTHAHGINNTITTIGNSKLNIAALQYSSVQFSNNNVNFENSFKFDFSTNLVFSGSHSGFLTVGRERLGLLYWELFFCTLENHLLKFYTYPNCDKPVEIIDLRNCVGASINAAESNKTLKPRTLQIEIGCRRDCKDIQTNWNVVLNDVIVKFYYLCFATNEELHIWKICLNKVLNSLKNWRKMKIELKYENSEGAIK